MAYFRKESWLKWRILSSAILIALIAVAFLPANTPASQYVSHYPYSIIVSHDYSLVPVIPAPTDSATGIGAGKERPPGRVLTTRDPAPLIGPHLGHTIAGSLYKISVFSVSIIGKDFHPLYQILDIPPPSVLA